jgi:hypothetical protein
LEDLISKYDQNKSSLDDDPKKYPCIYTCPPKKNPRRLPTELPPVTPLPELDYFSSESHLEPDDISIGELLLSDPLISNLDNEQLPVTDDTNLVTPEEKFNPSQHASNSARAPELNPKKKSREAAWIYRNRFPIETVNKDLYVNLNFVYENNTIKTAGCLLDKETINSEVTIDRIVTRAQYSTLKFQNKLKPTPISEIKKCELEDLKSNYDQNMSLHAVNPNAFKCVYICPRTMSKQLTVTNHANLILQDTSEEKFNPETSNDNDAPFPKSPKSHFGFFSNRDDIPYIPVPLSPSPWNNNGVNESESVPPWFHELDNLEDDELPDLSASSIHQDWLNEPDDDNRMFNIPKRLSRPFDETETETPSKRAKGPGNI